MIAPATPKPVAPGNYHADASEYIAFVRGLPMTKEHRRLLLLNRRKFVARFPDFEDWYRAPLANRIGRLAHEDFHTTTDPVCWGARGYVIYLGFRGHARLDYDWLLGRRHLSTWSMARNLGFNAFCSGVEDLADQGVRLGFKRPSTRLAIHWSVGRLLLHTGHPAIENITAEDIDELIEAVYRFGERPDVADFHTYFKSQRWSTALHKLKVLLYHRGQINQQPKKVCNVYAVRFTGNARLEPVVVRYLAIRRLTDRPETVQRMERTLRNFMAWLAESAPEIETFADVERDHVVGFLTALATIPSKWTGKPLAVRTRIGATHCLGQFFRDTATWGWEDVPGRTLLGPGDAPKPPHSVPRYIPTDELARLMPAIRDIECPLQRTALLVARWSGARRGEIRRLSVDCLDRYPDGTARLRLPAGKTFRERTVPLHEEAAQSLNELLTHRQGGQERGFIDELSGATTYYLFLRRGKLLSELYLFDIPLRRVCNEVGLLTSDGHPTISAHRFRHTVGTQLAERGAKLRTIMSVLGHQSAGMSMVYASISDPEVLRDYQSVLGPGASIAGPCAEALHAGALPESAIDWLKTNFFKTELELGHCLRLPQEGPCQCDLYLTCAKFVTTPAYAPRLRRRRRLELELVEDAAQRGWPREAERHTCTADHIAELLNELGEPIDGAEEPDLPAATEQATAAALEAT